MSSDNAPSALATLSRPINRAAFADTLNESDFTPLFSLVRSDLVKLNNVAFKSEDPLLLIGPSPN